MPDITNLVTNTTLNAKINEVKGEIIRIAIKKKMTITQQLQKLKVTLLQIIVRINILLLDILEFNELAAKYFTARLAQANLASKSDLANFVKKRF